jgi:hypothetical protein
MHGKKLRMYNRGTHKLCTQCYGPHARKQCTNQNISCVKYLTDLRLRFPNIPPEFSGKWWNIAEELERTQAESKDQRDTNQGQSDKMVITRKPVTDNGTPTSGTILVDGEVESMIASLRPATRPKLVRYSKIIALEQQIPDCPT